MKRRNLRVVSGGEKYPFSTGELVEALQGAGVLTDQAIGLSRELEKHYRSKGLKRIELQDLMDHLSRRLEEEHGPEIAERLRSQTPPFIPLMIDRDGVREAFSKRTLTAGLEKIGLTFKEAYSIADQVEKSLRAEGHEIALQRDCNHTIALLLEARHGTEYRHRFEAETRQLEELLVAEPGGFTLPYSRGILARSLMVTGLGPDLSHSLARRMEVILWKRNEWTIQRQQLRAEVEQLLAEEAGEEFVRRYTLIHRLKQRDRPTVILIGGTPGVGKSSLAAELAYRLGIARIVASDSVRQALRSLIGADLSPALHSSSYALWRTELLPSERMDAKPKRKRVIRGFLSQVRQLGTALGGIVERNVFESVSVVMEGVHLVPGIAPDVDVDATVIELVLTLEDEEAHRKHFVMREGQTRRARWQERYLDHFTEIRYLQEFVARQAQLAGAPVVETSDFDRAIETALDHVLDILLSQDGAEDSVPSDKKPG
ncbi:MAG: hypothetical protein OXC09_04740 [Truepera sp.]|nr:hypothetical protein [Truepera sp.]